MFTPEIFMDMLKDKESMIAQVIKDFDSSEKNLKTFGVLLDKQKNGETLDMEKVAKAYTQSLKHLNSVNMRLLIIVLVYLQSDSFTGDSAQCLVKFGRGKEALQEMFKQKMQGK